MPAVIDPTTFERVTQISRDNSKWLARRLARAGSSARVQIARDELRRIRDLTRSCNELYRQLTRLV